MSPAESTPMLSDDDLSALVRARHHDPFAVLGMHADPKGRLWVHAMEPHAVEVDVLDTAGAFVAKLERRLQVELQAGPEIEIHADPDQLEQLLINLLHNAVDAALETSGGVRVGWERENGYLDVWVQDDGPGIPNSTNLFVPFFTTKPGGSGIGLVLSRQIAEAHNGVLTLRNAAEGPGCEATIALPVQ